MGKSSCSMGSIMNSDGGVGGSEGWKDIDVVVDDGVHVSYVWIRSMRIDATSVVTLTNH